MNTVIVMFKNPGEDQIPTAAYFPTDRPHRWLVKTLCKNRAYHTILWWFIKGGKEVAKGIIVQRKEWTGEPRDV